MTRVKIDGERLILKDGVYKRLEVYLDEIESVSVDRRVGGAFCVAVSVGGKRHRFKFMSKSGAQKACDQIRDARRKAG
ncbi:hypothetical protein EG878_14710 [Enterococcus faecalis]|nr:hypothetical protein EG878_14710 [Enterococcus faecalis]